MCGISLFCAVTFRGVVALNGGFAWESLVTVFTICCDGDASRGGMAAELAHQVSVRGLLVQQLSDKQLFK